MAWNLEIIISIFEKKHGNRAKGFNNIQTKMSVWGEGLLKEARRKVRGQDGAEVGSSSETSRQV